MDGSCGKGLPVACAAVIDKRSGAVMLRFGAHPRFETALERTHGLEGRSAKICAARAWAAHIA